MTSPDIVLFATQRLTDNANGGGQLTANIIPDNRPNNLFGPISRIARADGNVSLRKAIAKALTPTTQTFFGFHAIIAQPPANEDVCVQMFSTNSWADVRSQAADFIESYLVQGPQTRMWAYGQQVIGARAIIVYQPPGEPLPSIGDTYVLVNLQATPNVSQFVRITSIAHRVQTFTDTIGSFDLNIITLGISSKLASTFPGATVQRYSTPAPPSLLCLTDVANAATYYGVQKLSADVSSGDETATLTSVFGQLLPSTQGETNISLTSPAGVAPIVASAPGSIALVPNLGQVYNHPIGSVYAGIGIMPGTVQLKDSGGVLHAVDDASGNVYAGTVPGGELIGTVDYRSGAFNFLAGNSLTAFFLAFIARPGVAVVQSPYTAQQEITEATRGYIYTQTLNPLPAPGTTIFSYRSGGRWFDLRDDGSGTLKGTDGAGSGSVRFDSGAGLATLGALPDIGSSAVFAWGQSAQYDIRTGDAAIQVPAVNLQLANPAKPGTVSITFYTGATLRTVTDDGAGNLTGYGTGTIRYGAGLIQMLPTTLPDPSGGISVAYQTNPATTQHLTPSLSGGEITLNLTGAPIAHKSIFITYSNQQPASYLEGAFQGAPIVVMRLHDDGAGNLYNEFGTPIIGALIDYTAGTVTFNPDSIAYGTPTPVYTNYQQSFWDPTASPPQWMQKQVSVLTGWQVNTITVPFVNGTTVVVTSTAASATNVSTSESFPTPAIKIDLTPTTVEPIVPGSILFVFAGDTYVDRAGSLYRNFSYATGAGTLAGSVDYVGGLATITNWPSGGASTLSVKSLLCEFAISPVGYLNSRVLGQSVRPGSFYIQANRVKDNLLVSATANTSGDFSNSHLTGHIDVATGMYGVQFGQSVLDSSLTSGDKAEPWYDASNVDGTGHIWRPAEVFPETIKYSAVVETMLPLSAGVLGLDPVRLPQDGRVQNISAGNVLCFRNPLVYSVSPTPTAGSTINVGRGGLESAVLYDANAVQVDTSQYTVDLATGILTMSPASGAVAPQANFDLSAYTAPYSVTHTQGELVLCTDAEITGQIAFSPGLVNDYPAASSFVSSCLIAESADGDLQASYDTKFEQTTWNFDPNHLWDDVVHGSSPTAVYDDLNYPIQVLDRDAITQRVAFIFTSSTGGQIAFEEIGIIGTFDTSHDAAPINPATSGDTAVTSGSFTIAAVGATQSVSVVSAADLEAFDRCTITDGTHTVTGTITAIAGTTLTVRTDVITAGVAGNTMGSAAALTVANPYFILDHRGWGTGWADANALRVNFHGCGFPIWYVRSVQVGASETADDHFLAEQRWDR